jgi:protein-tyrosine-phosphatase/DNA-binding transcriptional ArsR family regulator
MAAVVAPDPSIGPPAFLALVAHPLRWQLLGELVRSDRTVRELTDLVDARQSLVSYHLTQLGKGRLVSSRPSAADGRDRYYTIDLLGCEAQLAAAGRSLHPALGSSAPADRRTVRTKRVLFLCTGNSARSQMAEALATAASAGTIEARSAGSHPKRLHPNAVRVLRTRGIDISHNQTKHLDEFVGQPFDVVVTLCDKVREVCPELPSRPATVHWSLADPALSGSTDAETYPAFEALAAELETRVRFLLPLLDESPEEEADS